MIVISEDGYFRQINNWWNNLNISLKETKEYCENKNSYL